MLKNAHLLRFPHLGFLGKLVLACAAYRRMSKDSAEKMTTLFHGSSSPLRTRLRRWLSFVRDFFYGMTAHELNIELRREKGYLNHLFMCVVFGDLVGLPLLPPYYAMRLLPYVIPTLQTWKRGLLREKDITDLASRDL